MDMHHDRVWALLLASSIIACGDAEKGAEGGGDEAAYETAAEVLKASVATISAYQPHLDLPELEGPYTPKDNRNDLATASYFAANAIRHAANDGRQKAKRSDSAAAKSLVDPMTAIAVACATPEDRESVEKCKAAVAAFDEQLATTAEKAKAAGSAATIPRVSEAAVDDAAREEVALFVAAKGPNPAETALLTAMKDEKVTPKQLLDGCQKTMTELDGVLGKLASKPEDLKKVAIVHKEKVKAWCVRMGDMAAILQALEGPCADNASTDDCKEMCAKGRRRLSQGTVAAAFERLKEVRAEVCEDEEAK
ncbi:MAG: hypothetical protein AAGN82_16550 [Myxococcota bacterium]